jgi:NAD(P)-dependent dehydrogenase (short-subunit alcohol dehydrogenase family)
VTLGTAEFGGIDILVNNAAISWFEPTVTYPAKRLDIMYELLLQALSSMLTVGTPLADADAVSHQDVRVG